MATETRPARSVRAEAELSPDALSWLELYRQKRDEIAEATEVQKLAATKLREAVGAAEVVRYGGEVVISYPRFTTTRLDIARLREERPDIFEAYSVTRESSSFRVDPQDGRP